MKHRELEERENKILEPYLPKLKNPEMVFALLRKRFPEWTSIYAVKQNLSGIYVEDLQRLVDQGLLEKQKFLAGQDENNKPVFEEWFRLTPNGFSYINNAEHHKTNKWLFWLTIITAISGVMQLAVGVLQIMLK